MKNILFTLQSKVNLLKRGSVEAVNDILMIVCDIGHARRRKLLNALAHIFSGLTAYTFMEHNSKYKPARINV